MILYSSFEIVHVSDTMILIKDLSIGRSVTNDAMNVVACLNKIIPGGIRARAVYYQDSDGRFDRIVIKNGVFDGFIACTVSQQKHFSKIDTSGQPWYVYGHEGTVTVVGHPQLS